MKPTPREILDKAQAIASENGTYIAQSFPAHTTSYHITPSNAFLNPENKQRVVDAQIQRRDNFQKGEEAKSAYRDARVFYTASDIHSGALNNVLMPTCFANRDQALAYQIAQTAQAGVDHTVPQTQEECRKLVHTLFQAFKSVVIAEDNEKFLEQWKKQHHDNCLVEIACWELLGWLMERTTRDAPLQRRYFSTILKRESYAYSSFAERFDSIIYIISRNKTVCKSLLDPPRMAKLVDDPIALKAKTDNNRTINAYKADTMRLGRGVEEEAGISRKRRRGMDTPEGTPGDNDGNDDNEVLQDQLLATDPFSTPTHVTTPAAMYQPYQAATPVSNSSTPAPFYQPYQTPTSIADPFTSDVHPNKRARLDLDSSYDQQFDPG